MTSLPDTLFGIYIHWPYCARICPYCDFNVYAAKDRDNSALQAAILNDIRGHYRRVPQKTLTSIYFGGGTPSLCEPRFIAELIDVCASLWPSDDRMEITLEVNPEDVTRDRLKAWRNAGINRLSLGLQSLDDAALKFLGRQHTAEQGRLATKLALQQFSNVSIDLIYARPGQSSEHWHEELARVLELGVPHLSLYELTIKEKTAFAKQVERAQFIPMDDDAQADLYLSTLDLCAGFGLPAYEVSNHAGHEHYQSRHNLTYWTSGDWLGIGPGAEGKINLDGQRTTTLAHRRVTDYIAAVEETGLGWSEQISLSRQEAADEKLIMGLRSTRGVSQPELETAYGTPLDGEQIALFETQNWLICRNDRLRLTREGWLMADYISARLSP
ncbi:MAG: coproporphyrinogen III oxidase [Ponticaulis sp.]|nr:coproporphyrinogen III oxidase [Ponticaulis sp.]|tara:strand:+ start:71555 stop:72709 length:1155 start_codon:yes stop_codon:yes gene_type:complete